MNTESSLLCLCEALSMLQKPEEYERFLKDLCTPQEMKALSERWEICRLLNQGRSYRDIQSITQSSLTTIGRVARFLNLESYAGYRLVLERMENSTKIPD